MSASRPLERPSTLLSKSGFVVLPENRSAYRAIQRLGSFTIGKSRACPVVFLHGPPGSGKSHLMHGLLKRVIAQQPGMTARLVAARDLARFLSEDSRTGLAPTTEFSDCDLLLVEDMQFLPSASAGAFTALFDFRDNRRMATAFTASVGPVQLLQLPARLLSRLASGLVVGIDPLSFDSRHKLASTFCERRGLKVSDDVYAWLARSPSGGARPILGEIAQLENLASQQALPLNRATVEAKLAQAPAQPVIERLAEQVAAHYELSLKQLRGRARRPGLVQPRQVAMYLARKLTGLSLPRIGTFFGGYDHSTVLHSCRKVEERLRDDAGLSSELSKLTALCR